MPWQNTGNFLRTNNQFTGVTVWEQDQQASIKIIASRHDFHDEDLATGIEQCLNVDGYNKMLAPLDMNGFEIVNFANIAQGTFTPTLYLAEGETTSGQMFWHRTGSLVLVFGRISWAVKPTNNIEFFEIEGLPYLIPDNAEQLGNGFLARVQNVAFGNLGNLNERPWDVVPTLTSNLPEFPDRTQAPPTGEPIERNLSHLGLQGVQNTDRMKLFDSFSYYSHTDAGESEAIQYGTLVDDGYLELQFSYATDDPI